MFLFYKQLQEIREYIRTNKDACGTKILPYKKNIKWPSGNNRNIVFTQDTGIELGNPDTESLSCLFWVEDPGKIKKRNITLIGPDLHDCTEKSIPFGRIIMAGVTGFNSENSYARYRELEALRYDLDLKGYMMRAVSQYQREWSRISTEALENGFSLKILGSSLMDRFMELDYVKSVEIIFITAGCKEVKQAREITGSIISVINAMNKMAEEMSFECNTCEYIDVCSEVAELRSMRKTLQKGG